jgi:hypothetical protein
VPGEISRRLWSSADLIGVLFGEFDVIGDGEKFFVWEQKIWVEILILYYS